MNRFKVYCGPTLVDALDKALQAKGVEVYLMGTEHVYVKTNCTAEELLRLLKTVMHGFTHRDVYCLNHSC